VYRASCDIPSLLQELPGRIWEGKECLLEALGALCKAAPTQLDSRLGKRHATFLNYVKAHPTPRNTRFCHKCTTHSTHLKQLALSLQRGSSRDVPPLSKQHTERKDHSLAVVDALVAAMERPKSSYRYAALLSLGMALSHLKGNFYSVVAPPLLRAVDAAQETDRKVDAKPALVEKSSLCGTCGYRDGRSECLALLSVCVHVQSLQPYTVRNSRVQSHSRVCNHA